MTGQPVRVHSLRLRHPALVALLLGAVGAPPGMQAQERQEVHPLFKVQIEHEFPDGRETLDELMQLILENYYTDNVDEKSLWWGAVKGMLRQISPEENETLATIWLPEEYADVSASLQGVQESIGIKSSFSPVDGSLTVTEVMEGGPSQSLLLPYDRIVRIDGIPLKGLAVPQVDRMLKGEPGSRVSLKVVRDVAVFDLLVTRERVKVENVEVEVFPDNIGYALVRKFSEGVSAELKERLLELAGQGVADLLLDFRGNSGGVLNESIKCAELFIPKDQAVMLMVSHGSKIAKQVSGATEPLTFNLAILIDEGSASASEIVAAALRDNAGAKLVGARSYGKASIERTYTLANKYRAKFTIAALYSPKGKGWHKNGLLPDFPVAQDRKVVEQTRNLPPETRLTRDQQLRVAHQLLCLERPQ